MDVTDPYNGHEADCEYFDLIIGRLMYIFINFHESLNFFLKDRYKGRAIEYPLVRRASVKDIIESFGVPHTETGCILFNNTPVDFSFIPASCGTLQVDAIIEPFKLLQPSLLRPALRPAPADNIKFIADVNVIKLGRLLILLGFNVVFSPFWSDKKIADMADETGRVVLTRDTGLLKRSKIVFARRIRADLPYDQLVETIRFFGLAPLISFFSRCTQCNKKLKPVSKEEVLHLLEPKTKLYFNSFFQCPECKKVFWRGSHYDNILKKISSLGIAVKR